MKRTITIYAALFATAAVVGYFIYTKFKSPSVKIVRWDAMTESGDVEINGTKYPFTKSDVESFTEFKKIGNYYILFSKKNNDQTLVVTVRKNSAGGDTVSSVESK